MKLIALSKKARKHKERYFAQVNDEDFEWLDQWDWSATKRKNVVYAQCKINDTIVRMHRFIMGATAKELIDHKDRNGLNNQRDNLRKCTKTENCHNAIGRIGTSIYKGVHFTASKYRKKRWVAQIKVDDCHKYLGAYHTEVEAAQAYNEAAIKFFGEFARINVL